ncbi:MAG: 50S ribosomal protein L10 [Metamycoplasmataceae bacterium]
MNKFQKEKRRVSEEILENINNSQSMIVAKYQGLSVKQIQELRKMAKEKDVFIKIYKNRLVKKSVEGSNYESISNDLVGPNLYAFSKSDSISAAKVLAEFAKKNKALELGVGIFENEVIDNQKVIEISTLPSYEEALTILANSLQGGLKQLSIGLKLLVDENHIK